MSDGELSSSIGRGLRFRDERDEVLGPPRNGASGELVEADDDAPRKFDAFQDTNHADGREACGERGIRALRPCRRFCVPH